MEERTLSEKESMELITSMINKARNRFNETGIIYLVYGWVIFICEFQSLLIAVAVVIAWIIPGYILKENLKKES